MQAAIHAGERRIELVDINRPSPLPGTVLIQVGSVGICGSDLHVYRNVPDRLPMPRGHEYAGKIVELGDGVDASLLGKQVTVDIFLNAACHKCQFCQSGNYLHCQSRPGPITEGGFAEYVCVNADAVFPLPDGVDIELGALTEPLAVSVHAVRKLSLAPSSVGVVVGGGSIGLTALAALIDAGVERVIVIAKHQFQRDMAMKLGAHAAFSIDDEAAFSSVFAEQPFGADFAIEAVGGAAHSIEYAAKFLGPLGQLAVLGAFHPGVRQVETFPLMFKEISVIHSNCYGKSDGKYDFEVALDILSRQGELLRKLITHRFPLKSIAHAFTVADDKEEQSIKVHLC